MSRVAEGMGGRITRPLLSEWKQVSITNDCRMRGQEQGLNEQRWYLHVRCARMHLAKWQALSERDGETERDRERDRAATSARSVSIAVQRDVRGNGIPE